MNGRYTRRQTETPELPKAADKTLAYFALCVNRKLSSAAKSVGGCLVDHFNRKTGRCDPGIETIARETEYDRSTVILAIIQLEKAGYVLHHRHGGKWRTNRYEIFWSKFRQVKSSNHRVDRGSQDRVRRGRKNATVNGCENATQTFEGTFEEEPLKMRSAKKAVSSNSSQSHSPLNIQGARTTQRSLSSEVMVEKAEKRWEDNLRQALGENYPKAVEMITPELAAATTEYELQHRGRGHELILTAMHAEWSVASD